MKSTIRQTIDEIERRHGKGAIMSMDTAFAAPPSEAVAVLPTGVASLDTALGVGGLPRGRLVEVFGPEGAGKTVLALQLAASVQRLESTPGHRPGGEGVVAWIDTRHELDPKWAAAQGVDVSRLLISQPDNSEQALEIAEMLVRSLTVSLIVVDDVGGLKAKSVLEGDDFGLHEGLESRLMSQAMRKLTGFAARSGTTVVFLTQTRTAQQPGLQSQVSTTGTGANAVKFYASVRLLLLRQPTTRTVSVRVVKNKLAPPFQEATFELPGSADDAARVAELVCLRLDEAFKIVNAYTHPGEGGGWTLQQGPGDEAHVRDAHGAVVCTPRPAIQVCNWLDGFIAARVLAGK